MAARTPVKEKPKAATRAGAGGRTSEGFTDQERAAMKERVRELKAAGRRGARPDKDGDVVCFFQGAHKFKVRYATLGFSDKANLDDGAMWPTAFALKTLADAEAAAIGALVKRAVDV